MSDDELNRLAEKYRIAIRALILAVGIDNAQYWLRLAESEG